MSEPEMPNPHRAGLFKFLKSDFAIRLAIPSALSVIAIIVSSIISGYQVAAVQDQIDATFEVEYDRQRADSFKEIGPLLQSIDYNNEEWRVFSTYFRNILSDCANVCDIDKLKGVANRILQLEKKNSVMLSEATSLLSRDSHLWYFYENRRGPYLYTYDPIGAPGGIVEQIANGELDGASGETFAHRSRLFNMGPPIRGTPDITYEHPMDAGETLAYMRGILRKDRRASRHSE